MSESVYIHIPFCKSKCYYCSFVSFCSIEDKSEYLKSLKKEILSNYENETLKTLYIGGGTPSILTPCQIGELIKLFKTDSSTEITVELNPEDIDYNKITNLASEAKQKLSEIRPTSIGQAIRISGVNPADISILSIYLKKEYNK